MITESIRNRILNHMLAIAGYDRTVSHVRALPNWFRDYTMTTEQEAQWLKKGPLFSSRPLASSSAEPR